MELKLTDISQNAFANQWGNLKQFQETAGGLYACAKCTDLFFAFIEGNADDELCDSCWVEVQD